VSDVDPSNLIALGSDRLVAVECDEGQGASYDIVDLAARRRVHTTPLLGSYPVGSADGRWLAYHDEVTVGGGDNAWPIVVVDLAATPPVISHHQVTVPVGTKMLWGGLELAWHGPRLAVRCADEDYRRFVWEAELELPLGEQLALTRRDK